MATMVTAMPRASFLEDMNRLEMAFQTPDGPVVLSFEPQQFRGFAGRALALVPDQKSQSRTPTPASHPVEFPVEVLAAVHASPVVGGPTLVLSYRTVEGRIGHLSMSPEQSEALRMQMQEAEQKAKSDAAASRN